MSSNLADRVEGLAGPDEAVDAEVCKAFGILRDVTHYPMPMDGPSYWSGLDEFGNWTPVEPYTASLDAVVALIEKELPQSRWGVQKHKDHARAWVRVEEYQPVVLPEYRAATPAPALLAAFLRAKEADHG